jgi:hypothetical protein
MVNSRGMLKSQWYLWKSDSMEKGGYWAVLYVVVREYQVPVDFMLYET